MGPERGSQLPVTADLGDTARSEAKLPDKVFELMPEPDQRLRVTEEFPQFASFV